VTASAPGAIDCARAVYAGRTIPRVSSQLAAGYSEACCHRRHRLPIRPEGRVACPGVFRDPGEILEPSATSVKDLVLAPRRPPDQRRSVTWCRTARRCCRSRGMTVIDNG